MKIYKKSASIFLLISILIVILAFVSYSVHLEIIGSLLLGISASAIIITIQCRINYKIELAKTLIPYLKEMKDSALMLSMVKDLSIELYIHKFPEKFFEIKENIDTLKRNKNIISDFDSLKRRTSKKVKAISKTIMSLEESVHLIFKYYPDTTEKQKQYLFIELINIVSNFDFDKLGDQIFELACSLDVNEFINTSISEKDSRRLKDLEYKTSKKVFLKQIEENNKTEYEALKQDFDIYSKTKMFFDTINGSKNKKSNTKKKQEE